MSVNAPPRTGLATSSGRLATASNAAFALSSVPTHLNQVSEGRLTFTIYSLIRKRKYAEVIRLLSPELQTRPTSRAALSLLAYCYYQRHDFLNAASW
jgi:tetratricopeptide repeat protein 30